jgi:PmbA protein
MDDLAEKIVTTALGFGAKDVVGRVIVDRNYQIRFSQNEPAIANEWRKTYGQAFLNYEGRIVGGEISDLNQIPETVGRLVKIAKGSQPNPEFVGLAKGPFKYRRLASDPKVVKLMDGSEYVQAAIGGALEEGAKETAGSFWRYHEQHYLHTSNGASGSEVNAGLYLSIRAHAGPESSGHGVSCANRKLAFDPERAGHKAGRIAALAKNPKLGTPGAYDVVFDPLIAGSLIDQLGGRSSAYSVAAGFSPLAGKLGKKVASNQVTLVDDATADTLGCRRFDEEGVPVRRKAIVQNGVLKTYLHNTSTAKKFKTKTTANAGLVAPSAHALILEPGDRTRDELFQDVRDGLWLTNTWYTRYQSYVAGDFSTIPRDGIFRIKDGEVAEVWKDIRLTDNLLGVWKRVKGLSKKTEQVQWWGEVHVPTMAPYALVAKVNVTRSAM